MELGLDVLVKVMERLPARALAAAACVSSLWTLAATMVGQKPRFASAISLADNVKNAVDEVTEKVLEAPFRPQFAMVFVSKRFTLKSVLKHLLETLPNDIPIVGCHSIGVLGVDAATDEYKEVIFDGPTTTGIGLVAGFLPGVRVESFVLEDMTVQSLETFMNGRAPKAVVLLSKRQPEINDFLSASSNSAPVIVGGCCHHTQRCLLAHCTQNSFTSGSRAVYKQDVVGLIFTEEHTDTPRLCLEVRNLGALVPTGPVSKVRRSRHSTALTMFVCHEENEDEEVHTCRKVSSPLHYMCGRQQQPGVVTAEGRKAIKKGDDIMFYKFDAKAAVSIREAEVDELRTATSSQELLCNLIFACTARQEREFFGGADTDGEHSARSFAGVPRVGMFCTGEIGPCPESKEVVGLQSYSSMFTLFGWE